MTKYKSVSRMILHDRLKTHKDAILKGHAEGKSINELAKKYGFNPFTLGDWIYFWEKGVKRKRLYKKGIIPSEKGKKRFSQDLLNQMEINSEYNKKLIKRVKTDNGDDTKMIRYICGIKV